MSVREPLVWWDETHRHYGWTCPDCGSSGINLGSVEQAKYGLAAHRQLCTPQRTATRGVEKDRDHYWRRNGEGTA